jgi:hypothetical protein
MLRLRDFILGAAGLVIVVAGIMIADHLTQRLEQRAADARRSECIGEVLKTDAPTMRLAAMAILCSEDE